MALVGAILLWSATSAAAVLLKGADRTTQQWCVDTQLKYGIIPGSSWGYLTSEDVKRQWGTQKCDKATKDSQAAWCFSTEKAYRIIPGKTWGSMPTDQMKHKWQKFACDQVVLSVHGAAAQVVADSHVALSQKQKAVHAAPAARAQEAPATTESHEKWCERMGSSHGVIPGSSWGSMTSDADKRQWGKYDCDSVFLEFAEEQRDDLLAGKPLLALDQESVTPQAALFQKGATGAKVRNQPANAAPKPQQQQSKPAAVPHSLPAKGAKPAQQQAKTAQQQSKPAAKMPAAKMQNHLAKDTPKLQQQQAKPATLPHSSAAKGPEHDQHQQQAKPAAVAHSMASKGARAVQQQAKPAAKVQNHPVTDAKKPQQPQTKFAKMAQNHAAKNAPKPQQQQANHAQQQAKPAAKMQNHAAKETSKPQQQAKPAAGPHGLAAKGAKPAQQQAKPAAKAQSHHAADAQQPQRPQTKFAKMVQNHAAKSMRQAHAPQSQKHH